MLKDILIKIMPILYYLMYVVLEKIGKMVVISFYGSMVAIQLIVISTKTNIHTL